MATLTFNGVEYAVDRAVKGTDYVHGYSADGACIVSIEGIADFSLIVYDGDYLSPSACAEEPRNEVVYVNGTLKTKSGTSVLAPDEVVYTDGVLKTKSGTSVLAPYAPISTITASYTLASSNIGKFMRINSSNAVTITVPADASVSLPAGTEIEFCRYGSGTVKFSPASGVTIKSVGSALSISDQYGCATLKKIGSNLWLLAGALG